MRRTAPLFLAIASCVRAPVGSPTVSTPTAAVAAEEPGSDSSVCHPAEFPDSAAGRRLEQLLAAMNSSELEMAQSFVATAMADEPRDRYGGFILVNAGDDLKLALCRVEVDVEDEVVAVLGGASEQGGFDYGVVVLSVDEGGIVASLGIMPATKEDLARPIELSGDADVREVVEDIADGLAGYVFADKAAGMAQRIRAARDEGEYAGITNGYQLAHHLMDDLFAVSQDKHLDVMVQAAVPEPPREPTPEELARFDALAARDNYGMPIAEIREGNLGYLEIVGFHPPEVAADAIDATMSKLAGADALVIDIRNNGGGSPYGVAYLSGYLFGDERIHLNDLYNRSQDRTESFYTSADVPGRRFGPDKPIFVLTSAQTFSAAEEFAYNLQAQGRATIVGETTGGGAHTVEFVRVSEHWSLVLPTARAINPITKTNWEGTGVKPDVEVPSEHAWDKAVELAAQRDR